jgi:hypothetical protein
MGRLWVGASLQHKMCLGGETNETIGPGPVRIDRMSNRLTVDRSGT